VHDAAGISLGADLSKYWGLELAMDDYELSLDTDVAGKVGELDMRTFMPQVRLRYPLMGNRLVPYAIAGVGVLLTQVNDTTAPVTWHGGLGQVRPAGAMGIGIEYFLTDDIALGTEGKYVIAGDGHYTARGEAHDLSLTAAMWTFGLRMYYPELHPAEAAERARRRQGSMYVALRTGGSLLETSDIFSSVSADPEQEILGSSFTVLFGVVLGTDFGRYAGLELSLWNRELRLNAAGMKGVGEYALFPVLLEPRLRYPLLDGRLEPYVIGGIGAEFADLNDTPDSAASLDMSASDTSFVAAIGAGLDYYVTSDISVGFELQYLFSRGHHFRIQGATEDGNLDALMLSVDLKAHFFDF
jgi:opacity protein-like surface antigen